MYLASWIMYLASMLLDHASWIMYPGAKVLYQDESALLIILITRVGLQYIETAGYHVGKLG